MGISSQTPSALLRDVSQRCIVIAILSCLSGPLWILRADAMTDASVGALTYFGSEKVASRAGGDPLCRMSDFDNEAASRLHALTKQIESVSLHGLTSDVMSQLWMGMPLTVRTFALPTRGAEAHASVVARLSQAQPLLHDLAVTNDGFMLVGRDDETQWAAHWQIADGWARGWLTALALHLPVAESAVPRQARSRTMSWLPTDFRLITHYTYTVDRDAPQSQGVWLIPQAPTQAVRIITAALVREGWVAQSVISGPWHRGSCVLDFRVLDARAVQDGSALPVNAHAFLWAFLRQAQQ